MPKDLGKLPVEERVRLHALGMAKFADIFIVRTSEGNRDVETIRRSIALQGGTCVVFQGKIYAAMNFKNTEAQQLASRTEIERMLKERAAALQEQAEEAGE